MSDLLSSGEKSAFDAAFDNLHDTFGRDIVIYKKSKKVFVATNNTYNALYSRIKNEKGSEKTVEAVTVKARIAYSGNSGKETQENEILGFDVPVDHVRIKINSTGYDLIKQASDIEVDGDLFDVVSDASKAGMFSVRYYNILLKRRG
jgi:hypothetical protein